MSKYVKLDQWAKDLLVDPLSKTPLQDAGNYLVSDYGREYPLVSDAIYDLRLFRQTAPSVSLQTWRKAQEGFEQLSASQQKHDARQNYEREKSGLAEVYEQIPIVGACLDVGGEKGRLRAFLDSDQVYLVVDPYLNAFDGIDCQSSLIRVYPFLLEKVNFLCALGEHLPIRSDSFDTVHMRSVIDHMYNPELALLEANRVLRAGGQLVIGSFVVGGKSGKTRFSRVAKDAVKRVLHSLGGTRFAGHVWQPTYDEFCRLIVSCGFAIDITHWQKGCDNCVCYIRAVKHL